MNRKLKLLLAELLIGAAALICGSLFLGIGMINYIKVTVFPLFTRRTEPPKAARLFGAKCRKESCYE